jgi:hypothetical protein
VIPTENSSAYIRRIWVVRRLYTTFLIDDVAVTIQ